MDYHNNGFRQDQDGHQESRQLSFPGTKASTLLELEKSWIDNSDEDAAEMEVMNILSADISARLKSLGSGSFSPNENFILKQLVCLKVCRENKAFDRLLKGHINVEEEER